MTEPIIKWSTTQRGFGRGEFVDLHGAKCSVQQSSLATEPALWLGCEHEKFTPWGWFLYGEPCGARMHLSVALAKELLQALADFIVEARGHG